VIANRPLARSDSATWIQAFRDITNATNERTLVTGNLPRSGIGNNAPAIDYEHGRSIASALVSANMNSIPLDWAARFSVGGVHMNFFILKQIPVLPPDSYLKNSACGSPYVELIVPRALQLSYASEELTGFARDLGFEGSPFPWNEQRRHRLQSELDAIFAHMYGLSSTDLEWILDATPPGSSFPSLKQDELKKFGEYRTKRLVLQAFGTLEQGVAPGLTAELRE